MSKVVESLKQIQADAHALYIKMHNYHWNIKGMDFFPVHSHTEEIYNSMSVLYDDTAERILQLGEKPYLTIKQLADATKIETETKDSFNSKEIVVSIIKEYNYLLNEFKHLSKVASENADKTTETFADDKIAKFEKDVWLMSNMIS
ncbi:DNA starvation/stationary phase protection protein [Malaciobacter molluscorum LMG 25693]|uniref:DNA starvation/stationary phase protection protein n=1 Tax=Malaciobacter molluscorum LMG 25693 TaxID=870501 RepID=A0A2G1DF77_9BACT|nr:DNA starvation/stationary phase protection protein [Malaciobacter molluscorum]AXX91521.1 DNA-binding ferritin-like protein [Malaciobacter molluscorum LMG 25693]PHO17158.1 DNA starvation/stationary phase protection protein [Malaciobacter molluscorum LMG 25693]